jgi:hypothetical protein
VEREGLEELFAPFAIVSTRRMFGGHGVYFDGLCFALSLGGDVYLKVDAETQAAFAAADSRPFVYAARGREVQVGYGCCRRRPSTTRKNCGGGRRWPSRRRGAPRPNEGRSDRTPAPGRSRRRSDRSRPTQAAAL